MNIAFFTPRFYPAISGGEFYILSLALKLRKFYQDSASILTSNAIDFKGIRESSGKILLPQDKHFSEYMDIPINRLNIKYGHNEDPSKFKIEVDILASLFKKIGFHVERGIIEIFLKNGPNLNNYFIDILEKKPNISIDLVHSVFLPYSTLLYSLLLSKMYNASSICTPFFHIYNPRYDRNEYLNMVNLFDGIIACTEVEKEYLHKNGIPQEKIRVIPMGIDYLLYHNKIKSKTGRLKSFSKKFCLKKPFILFCGYKNYEKGAISLLNSINLVWNKHPDIDFVFIGPSTHAFDIELKKLRKSGSGSKILNLTPSSLEGYFDWKKISAFQECEALVMPSRSDAYGFVYLEAWAAGKPVIAADNPVMREVINNGKDGILVEFDNKNEISGAVINLIENPEYSKQLGKNGQDKIKKFNLWNRITSETRKFYKELIEKKKN